MYNINEYIYIYIDNINKPSPILPNIGDIDDLEHSIPFSVGGRP